MIEASCPTHGRRCLTNAGAPNLVRCAVIGTSYEPCRQCGGGGELATGCMTPDVPCDVCGGRGWTVYPGRADGVHPVS